VYATLSRASQFQKARAVIVSANGAEPARLLLLPSSPRFPQGVANSSGLVGKYLMINGYHEVHARFDEPLNEYKSVAVSRVLHDFYELDPKLGFYGGGGLDARFGLTPVRFALGIYRTTFHAGARLTRTGLSRTRGL
jgi:hypothetical protein